MVPDPVEQGREESLRARIAELERELAQTREHLRRLEELDRLQSDFSLTVSHELRTPLTLISGYAQKLLMRWNTTSEEKRQAMVEKINISSHRLSRLIDDFLLITDVERGNLEVHRRDVELSQIVATAVEDVRDRHPSNLPAIVISGPRLWVQADGFRLEQVLICLVDNAVKHSPQDGVVTVTWECKGDRSIIAVADQGGGIAPDNLPRLFERFRRLEHALGQSRGGVGLGLYIARQLVEAMGGAIWVESTLGSGSTFYVSLPTGTPTA